MIECNFCGVTMPKVKYLSTHIKNNCKENS